MMVDMAAVWSVSFLFRSNREGHENTWAWTTVNLQHDLFQYFATATAWLVVFICRLTVFVVCGSMTYICNYIYIFVHGVKCTASIDSRALRVESYVCG